MGTTYTAEFIQQSQRPSSQGSFWQRAEREFLDPLVDRGRHRGWSDQMTWLQLPTAVVSPAMSTTKAETALLPAE